MFQVCPLYSQYNLEEGGRLEGLRDFTRVFSDFYEALAFHYHQVNAEWYAAAQEHERSDLDED